MNRNLTLAIVLVLAACCLVLMGCASDRLEGKRQEYISLLHAEAAKEKEWQDCKAAYQAMPHDGAATVVIEHDTVLEMDYMEHSYQNMLNAIDPHIASLEEAGEADAQHIPTRLGMRDAMATYWYEYQNYSRIAPVFTGALWGFGPNHKMGYLVVDGKEVGTGMGWLDAQLNETTLIEQLIALRKLRMACHDLMVRSCGEVSGGE